MVPHVPRQVRIAACEADGVLGDPLAEIGVVPTVEVVLESNVLIEQLAGEAKVEIHRRICLGK